jgi:hypothetical protein
MSMYDNKVNINYNIYLLQNNEPLYDIEEWKAIWFKRHPGWYWVIYLSNDSEKFADSEYVYN